MKLKSERLPGMPGPSEESINRRRKLENVFHAAHEAIFPLLEGLPVGGNSKLSIRRAVRGDVVTITVQPGKDEE